jgi:DNA ligase (NAD+)
MKTQDLVNKIKQLNEAYRKGTPQVSDVEYDALLEQLAAIDPENPILKKNILEDTPKTRKRDLSVKMMSLDKLKSVDAIKKWISDIGLKSDDVLIMTGKYNGISILRDYDKNQASTRGDGSIGQDCDAHFKLIEGINFIDNTISLCSGEAIISRSNWDAHFKNKLSPEGNLYKLNNATVAGLLNRDNPTEELKYVDFLRYNLYDDADMSKIDQLEKLNLHSETVVGFSVFMVKSIDLVDFDSFFHEINSTYPVDGLVIDVNDPALRQKLGRELNGNPRYARALKLDKWVDEFDTVITGHIFDISKQGKLKGVVTFEPVDINGTEVKQATFYNARFLQDMNLYVGAKITVKKSGEIIPKITAIEGMRIPIRTDFKSESDYSEAYRKLRMTIADSTFFSLVNPLQNGKCPHCNSNLYWDDNGVEMYCANSSCDGIRLSKIEHFFTAIEVEEFGRPTIETLYHNGFDSVEKILTIDRDQLLAIDGFAETSADILLDQFKKTMETGVPLARLMYAYDLFEGKLGEKTAQSIFDSVDWDGDLTKEEVLKVKGVSNITADAFMEAWVGKFDALNLLKVSYIKSPDIAPTGDKYVGFNVCFSGVRDKDLESEICSNGGKIASGVNKLTTHLIVSDIDQSTSKTVKARELQLPIMTIQQFKQL